jgi:glyoxalase-like protein
MSEPILRRSFMVLTGGALALPLFSSFQLRGDAVPPTLDHLILGCHDLDSGITYMEKLSGYKAAPGGSHPQRGTRNALLALGNERYLEILAPDPQQQDGLQWHKEIAEMKDPKLIGYALRYRGYDDLSALAESLRKRGIACSGPTDGSRTRPDGQAYRWRTVVRVDDKQGILPFYIAWSTDSPHPSEGAPGGCLLMDLSTTGLHFSEGKPPFPDARKVVSPDKTTQLHAKIAGLTGVFELTTRAVPSESWTTRPK